MEADQREDRSESSAGAVWRHSARADGSTDVGCVRGSRGTDTDNQAVPICQEMVDGRTDPAPADPHPLEGLSGRQLQYDFLADNSNIWKAAKYLDARKGASLNKILQLKRADGSQMKDAVKQAEELLSTFFPSLLNNVEDEGQRPQRSPVSFPELTLGEIGRQLFAAKSWKALGEEGLPVAVWK